MGHPLLMRFCLSVCHPLSSCPDRCVHNHVLFDAFTWRHCRNGVIQASHACDPNCCLDHGVLAVGFATESDTDSVWYTSVECVATLGDTLIQWRIRCISAAMEIHKLDSASFLLLCLLTHGILATIPTSLS